MLPANNRTREKIIGKLFSAEYYFQRKIKLVAQKKKERKIKLYCNTLKLVDVKITTAGIMLLRNFHRHGRVTYKSKAYFIRTGRLIRFIASI